MGGGIPSGLMRGWRFFRWLNQIGLTSCHNDLLPASNRLWDKGLHIQGKNSLQTPEKDEPALRIYEVLKPWIPALEPGDCYGSLHHV